MKNPGDNDATKLCYRCGGRFNIVNGSFARHDEICLRRAITAEARRILALGSAPAPFDTVRDIEVPF